MSLWVIKLWGKSSEITPTIWGADWDNYSTANCFIIALSSRPHYINEVVIVIDSLYWSWKINYERVDTSLTNDFKRS